MNTVDEINSILNEARYLSKFISDRTDLMTVKLDNDYQKLNHAYFNMSVELYKSFILLTLENQHFSSVVIIRTLLEFYVKSYHLELVQKEKNTDVHKLITEEKDFPKFHVMANDLDTYKSENGHDLGGHFIQYTKASLASYEKFSYFTHGKGPYLEASLGSKKAQLDTEGVKELLLHAKGIFETLSLLYFLVQGQDKYGVEVLNEMRKISPKIYG